MMVLVRNPPIAPAPSWVVKNMQARLALHAHGRILETRKQLIIFVAKKPPATILRLLGIP
jgi:hypothetical protein